MLFDTAHVLFIVKSFTIIALLETVLFFFVKTDNRKVRILKIAAVATVVIHYSSLYVDFFKTGTAEINDTMLLPVYPCNIAMWFLLIVAFVKNRESKVYKVMAEFTFYLGVVGGVVGILFNEVYAATPNLSDWSVLKGLLSHATMLFGAIYLLLGGFIKIRVSNTISVAIGMIFMVIDGGIIIGLYKLFNLTPQNIMYLLEPPYPNLPWLNTWVIGIAAVLLAFAITAVYEQIAIKKEDRWYNHLKGGKK